MSLLTQKQLEEIQTFHDDIGECTFPHEECFIKELIQWNEKQTAQFEPDWSKAPDDATSAVLSLTWITKGSWAFGHNIAEYERPAPVITPHPHAEIMAKYAEVAARRVDPWMEFEHCCDDIDEHYWIQCDEFIGFHADYFYRHIGDAK